jgi:hypothetical protein
MRMMFADDACNMIHRSPQRRMIRKKSGNELNRMMRLIIILQPDHHESADAQYDVCG